MVENRISSAVNTDMKNTVSTITIDSSEQDFPGTKYTCDWSKWFGYYKTIPELAAVVNKKAIWTLGKGFEADKLVKDNLLSFTGCGKDTFNDIMFNMVVAYTVGGDAFAEIVRDKEGKIINLKPINPGSLSILSGEKGTITGYEQNVTYGAVSKKIAFKPEDIFHLPWNRVGDECHGRSTIEKVEGIIDSINEARADMRIVFHRYVKPLIVTEVDEDDEAKVQAFKAKLDAAVKNGENMVVPKGTATMERMSIPQYSTLDPLPWLRKLEEYFIMAEGVPMIVLGHGGSTTEATAKIVYLAFQQNIEHSQRFLEAQIKAQLGLDVEFNFPADIAPDQEQGNVQTPGPQKDRKVNNLKEH
jgi:hypothetical protein